MPIGWNKMNFKKRCFLHLLPIFKVIGSIFFGKEYLIGKYFEESIQGWRWLLKGIFWQKILGINKHIPWPVSPFIIISNPNNILFDANDINNFQTFGNYFQNSEAKIYIGKGTYIAPNVGIITVNHNPNDLDKYLDGKDVIIGKKCWVGMNSIILPGVELGDNTIVGAGSIVTKSFPEGNVIIAGNPAKKIK
jgi:acetyltransferase-like isoleucine patch superfamily enzyme